MLANIYMPKFKDKLIGERIILKRLKPDSLTAKTIFKTVVASRQHLLPWFDWARKSKNNKVKDSLNYLLEVDKEFKAGKKIDYGIYLKDEYIGNVGIFNIDKKSKSAEIGYWLAKEFTRKGYMTEAVKVLEKEFFINFKLNRIQIKCDERNVASRGVAEKTGHILEGKFREDAYSYYFKDLRNTLIFSKLKSEFKKEK